MDFPGWIRRTRGNKSATECAKRAGVQQSVWSEWEGQSADWQPRKQTVDKIAKGLEVDKAVAREAAGLNGDTQDREELSQFAERLRAAMAIKRMGPTELAGRLGLSAQSVQAWADGENAPRLDKLGAIARHLECSADWLLGNDSAPAPKFTTRTVTISDPEEVGTALAQMQNQLNDLQVLFRDFSLARRQNRLEGVAPAF